MLEHVYTHTHDVTTNAIMNECPNSHEEFIKEINKHNSIKGIIFTNHGYSLNWFKKYESLKQSGYKYIHAVEAYTCLNFEDKNNYHILLYAQNKNGFHEINRLISGSGHGNKTGNYYRRPRIYIDEILKCKNIIISSACVAGVLRNIESEIYKKLISWGIENKDKFFLEIQPHKLEKQKIVNELAISLHEKHGLNLISSNDAHYTNMSSKRIREILETNKQEFNDDEHECDLSIKSAEKQYTDFLEICIDEKYIKSAMKNTVQLYNMCEEYEIDCNFKYPQIYDNPKKLLLDKCMAGLKKIEKLDDFKYIQRVLYELEGMEKLGSLSYINLFSDWLTWVKEVAKIAVGFSRGSSSGSLVCYLTKITNIDPICWGMSWDRFMNIERVTLSDIDTDFEPLRRNEAKKWFYDHPKLNCSEILTSTTQAWKGACDIRCRVDNKFDKDLTEKFKQSYSDIRVKLDIGDKSFKKKSPISIDELVEKMVSIDERFEIIKDVVEIEGVITAVGTHPAGVLVSDLDIESEIGMIYLEDKDNAGEYKKVSQCNMKELEAMGYVKADALGLANVGTISRTCKLVGHEFPDPQKFDFYDEKVWEDMLKAPQMIFQFEADQAFGFLKKALEIVSTDKKLHINSMMSGLIRPSGTTTRNAFLNGESGNNGHPVIDAAFPETSSFIVYQEQIIEYLCRFCGYSYAKSDIIRRMVAKKGSDEKFKKAMEDIERDFRDYFPNNYDATEEQIQSCMKSFLAIVKSSQDYGFSLNHALPYTMIGYICAWYRYYHPIEYVSSNLNEFNKKPDKMKEVHSFIQQHLKEVEILQPKFPYVHLEYTPDSKNNIIYEGMLGAKGVGKNVELAFDKLDKSIKFKDPIEVFVYMKDNKIVGAGKPEFINLNKLGFFSEFEMNQRRVDAAINMMTNNKVAKYNYNPKQKEATRAKKLAAVYEVLETIPDENFSDFEQATYDLEILGHTDKRFEGFDDMYFVLSCKKPHSKYILKLYNMATGEIETMKAKTADIKKPKNNTVIQISKMLKDDWFKAGETSSGKPKFKKTGTQSWNVMSYEEIKL